VAIAGLSQRTRAHAGRIGERARDHGAHRPAVPGNGECGYADCISALLTAGSMALLPTSRASRRRDPAARRESHPRHRYDASRMGYSADDIGVLEGLESVRRRTTMYLEDVDEAGLLYCVLLVAGLAPLGRVARQCHRAAAPSDVADQGPVWSATSTSWLASISGRSRSCGGVADSPIKRIAARPWSYARATDSPSPSPP
jgi:hypothetical protein